MQGIQKCMYMNNLEYMFYEHACHHIHTNSFPQLHFFLIMIHNFLTLLAAYTKLSLCIMANRSQFLTVTDMCAEMHISIKIMISLLKFNK